MSSRDIKVLKKVYDNANKYEWSLISHLDKYYSRIDFPSDAKKGGNIYASEVKKGLIIITGTFQIRFYYEEDNYTWDKKYFAAIISDVNNQPSSIAFITNEDYENMVAKNDLFNFNLKFRESQSNVRTNVIVDLYDIVNRKVSGIEDLYSDFLNDDM